MYAREVRSVWMHLWQAEPLWIHKISGPHHSEQLTWCTCWNGDQMEWTSHAYDSSMWAWTKYLATVRVILNPYLSKRNPTGNEAMPWHAKPIVNARLNTLSCAEQLSSSSSNVPLCCKECSIHSYILVIYLNLPFFLTMALYFDQNYFTVLYSLKNNQYL